VGVEYYKYQRVPFLTECDKKDIYWQYLYGALEVGFTTYSLIIKYI
jgi:hypothetical protein